MKAKILVITNSYPNRHKSYAGKYIERHQQLHTERGLEVVILAPGDSRRGFLRSVWKYTKLSWRAFGVTLLKDFDLVHAHWELPSGLIGAIVCTVRRKPLVVTSHGAFTDNYEDRSWYIRYLVRGVLRRANKVVAVGQKQKRKVQAIANLSEQCAVAIHMGVWLHHTTINRLEAKRRLALPSNKKIIIFLGNLLWRKGVDILVRAVAILLQTDRSFHLIIGGQGPELENIQEQLRVSELLEVVTLIGEVKPESVLTWFSAADICVVPSRTEPFGLVAVEAMSCGTAVIAANVGGLNETIQHAENGFLFPVEDHVALAKCLQEVLKNDELRRQIGERGRQTAAAYDMRLQAAKVQSLYTDLLSKTKQHNSIGSV